MMCGEERSMCVMCVEERTTCDVMCGEGRSVQCDVWWGVCV